MKKIPYTLPDKQGHFGIFGGKFVPETLMPALKELEEVYQRARRDRSFKKELDYYLKEYAGRPTPLYFAKNLSKQIKWLALVWIQFTI